MHWRSTTSRRWFPLLIAFVIVALELAASYPMFLAARNAALARRFSRIEADSIGVIGALCIFEGMYLITAGALALFVRRPPCGLKQPAPRKEKAAGGG
jgi:hypothetical protein